MADVVRRQRARPRRRSQSRRREPLAKVQRAGDREHHPDADRAAAGRVHRARVRQQRLCRTACATTTTVECGHRDDSNNPIPNQAGKASPQIKHVVFINKENATHDLLLGDITQTRSGVPVNGEPAFSLGFDASPNHHELALAVRLQRQLLPRAVGVLGRPSLVDRPVHHRIRRDALAGVVRRSAQRFGRRSGGHQELSRTHRVHRRERVSRAERLQRARRYLPPPEPARQDASSTSATASSSP